METHTLIEWCSKCGRSAGQSEVKDEAGEDCNIFEALKEYKLVQRSQKPHRCSCGTVLEPQVHPQVA